MNLKLLKDKRVQLAAAAAAVLGLVVLLKKGTGDQSAAGTSGGSALNTGTLDSTGTDSYNAIGQIGQAWSDTWNQWFQQFSDQLGGLQDQLGGGPTTPGIEPGVLLPSYKKPNPQPAKTPVAVRPGSKGEAVRIGYSAVSKSSNNMRLG